MKERPILMSAPMVRAILEGRKTQTRRIVKRKHLQFLENIGLNFLDGKWNQRPFPYGQPGDRLWQNGKPAETGYYYIRGLIGEKVGGNDRAVWYNHEYETWGFTPEDDPESVYTDGFEWDGWKRPGDKLWVREAWADLRGMGFGNDPRTDKPWIVSYRADIKAGSESDRLRIDYGVKWKPSIHMPRWASRITLEITGVRVERLQDITNNDALDEGTPDLRTIENGFDMRRCFQDLWEQINGVGSWAENPWVWVIEFKKV